VLLLDEYRYVTLGMNVRMEEAERRGKGRIGGKGEERRGEERKGEELNGTYVRMYCTVYNEQARQGEGIFIEGGD